MSPGAEGGWQSHAGVVSPLHWPLQVPGTVPGQGGTSTVLWGPEPSPLGKRPEPRLTGSGHCPRGTRGPSVCSEESYADGGSPRQPLRNRGGSPPGSPSTQAPAGSRLTPSTFGDPGPSGPPLPLPFRVFGRRSPGRPQVASWKAACVRSLLLRTGRLQRASGSAAGELMKQSWEGHRPLAPASAPPHVNRAQGGASAPSSEVN